MIYDNSSVWKSIWNYVGIIFSSMHDLILKTDTRSIMCFRIKVDNCEIGIKNMGILSVLGDIIYNADKGELIVSKPIRLMKNKLEYL